MRRMRWAALAAAVTLAAGACAAIPDSGPVQEGNADVQPVEPLVPIQEGPGPADGPEAIVTGFLTASAGGIATDFSVAREFLTEDAAAAWDPGARTLVFDSGAVTPEWDQERGSVTYEVPLASTIDDSGRRADAAEGELEQLEFSIVEDAQGQWRIDELADGVVISEPDFVRFFSEVDLVFATADLTTAVPEMRWLPDANNATAVARELIEGPSSWLADAVRTGFPATAALAVESVVVTDGIATVDLTTESAGSPTDRSLAQQQLELTLTGLPNVTDVDVRVGGLPIATDASVVLDAPPVPGPDAAALVAGRLGMWDGEDLWVPPASVGGVGDGAAGVAVSYDGSTAAYIAPGANLVTADFPAPAGVTLQQVDEELEVPEGELETTMLVDGAALVGPSFDRHGYVWTAERSGASGLIAATEDAEPVRLGQDWLQTRSVVGVAVAPGGARIAVVSRAGGQPLTEVAAVVRDESGAPIALGEPIAVGTGVGAAVDLTWIDDVTIGILGEPLDGAVSPLWLAEVGGATTQIGSLQSAVALTARSGEPSILVVAEDGTMAERSGTSWSDVADGVTDIAYAG